MTAVQKVQKGKPLVIGKKAQSKEQTPQAVEERLAAIEANLAEIKAMLQQALG